MSSKIQSRYRRSGFTDLLTNEDIRWSKHCETSDFQKSGLGRPKSSISLRTKKSLESLSRSERNVDLSITQKNKRCMSAPAHGGSSRRSSVSSSDSSSSMLYYSGLPGRVRRHKAFYKQPNKVVCVRAFVNGDRDTFARVTAPDLKQLLEECTKKLGMVTAARKAFLSDGTLINDFHQINKNAEIYVSCGEPFKDPFGKYIAKEKLSQTSTWTVNGIVFPESETRGKTRPALSERLKVLVEKQKKRVLVFENEMYTEGKEVIVNRFDEFLGDCTQKLGLQSRAKALYTWNGKEIGDFSEVAFVENVLQPTSNTVIGPLWVTKGGEKFSFKGPYGFVDNLLQTTKERVKEAKSYENQLQSRLHGTAEDVSVEVTSLTEQEIANELEQISKKVRELEAVIPKLKSRKKQLKLKKKEEDMVAGTNHSSYKFQNITEIEENSRLLGKKGIRLKVYENGKIDDEVVVYFNIHEASKGVSMDRTVLLGRLLDTITAHQKVLKQGHGPAGRPLARRIYKDNGKEVLDVHELETDDSVWLSFGEKFISPYTYALQLILDKTKCVSLWNEKKIIQRESLNEDDVYGKERASLWRAVDCYPLECKCEFMELDMEQPERVAYAKGLQHSQIREKNTFLQYKTNSDLMLLPELSVDKKLSKGDTSMWPNDCQQWLVHKDGHITCRSFPQLCLSTTDIKVNVSYADGASLEGFVLKFAKRNASDSKQVWKFTSTGDICSEDNPPFVLTWIANEDYQFLEDEDEQSVLFGGIGNNDVRVEEKEEAIVENLSTMKDVYGGEKCSVALLPKLSAKHPAIGTQRWAIKQESLNNIGQWKFSQVPNPEWNRKALSWPVNQDGSLNEEFNWPLEGFLICNAPPVRRKETLNVGPPVRLRVLKNGEHDLKRAVTVVGPDLGNIAKDISGKSAIKSAKTRKTSPLPSSRNDIRSLELNLFLDRCTGALQLPFAARRVFDEHGTELFTLGDLERNQLVFVSCGESWLDYKISHSDQQRRIIINNLSADIAKLKLYCRLRSPQGLVLTINGPLTAGSPVCVGKCDVPHDEKESSVVNHQDCHDSQSDSSIEGVRSTLMSAHERAHVKSEERLKSLKWPWETAITSNGEVNVQAEQHGDFEHDVVYSNNRLHKQYRHHTAKSQSSKENLLLSCQWLYKDGWIQLRNNNQLVLGVGQDSTEDKLVNEVFLCKKKMDDINQRWSIATDGTIHIYNNPNVTLTVSDPGREVISEKSDRDGYNGSHVLVMPRKFCNGNANQLWIYDQDSGLISAFATDLVNKEITAANKAGICTLAVLGSKSVPQIGYSMQNDSSNIFLCEACGLVSRGRLILQRLEKSESFSCAMGKETAKQDKSSCFKCLSNEIDLTSEEADATLAMWENQLKRLRKITSVRSLTKEIQAAQSVPAVRIRAYKNGEGIRKEPVLIIGSTIDSLLDQCTCKLSLASAARRFYNIDGELITDISQLQLVTRASERALSRKNERTVQGIHKRKPTKDPVDVVYSVNDCNDGNMKDDETLNDLPLKSSESCNGKYCVDVFVSCGEVFIPLEELDKEYFLQMKHQYARNWVENYLETEKHVLRQIQGRRMAARSSTESRSWQDLTKQEEHKQENIEELTEHLKDLKTKQQQEREHLTTPNVQRRISTNKRLYDSLKTVRIDIYENGNAERRYVNVCGSSLTEILKICTSRLGLSAAARRMFTAAGDEVEDFSELVKGEMYCVSCGENFIEPKYRQSVVARKATWSRLNRQTGGAMAYKNHERTTRTMLALNTRPNQFSYH